jgi:hypothetical protein
MAYEILDTAAFLDDGIITEARFIDAVAAFDWNRYESKKVLVKGCGSTILPPWAFMIITARLVPIAHSIRYGNDHDNIVICRRSAENKST